MPVVTLREVCRQLRNWPSLPERHRIRILPQTADIELVYVHPSFDVQPFVDAFWAKNATLPSPTPSLPLDA